MKLEIKSFSELSLEELYEICKVRFEVFVCEQKITVEQDFDDKDQKCHHMFLKDNNKIIAYCRIVPKGLSYDGASIGRVLVLKEYRKRSLGQKLMEEAKRFIIDELGEEKIILSAQMYVKGLYESVGFKQISEVYDEAGIDHVKMEYSI